MAGASPITVARLFRTYNGRVSSRAPVITGLDPDRFKTVFIYLKKDSDEENFFEASGHKAYYIRGPGALNAFRPGIVRKLIGILRAEKADILHCHQHKPTVYGVLAAAFCPPLAVISHVHGLARSRRTRRRFANRLVFGRVDRILTVGEATRLDVLRDNPSIETVKVTSLGNSIDIERFRRNPDEGKLARSGIGLEEKHFVFGSVGRLVPTKGYDCLIRAFCRVVRQLPAARLVIAGAGRLAGRLRAEAAASPAAGSIVFLGERDDVPSLLAAFDAFVMPSIAEGSPRALLEAMASGLVCVGSRTGEIPEILDGLGRLVRPGDEEELAAAMLEAAAVPAAERQKIGAAAREKVRTQYSHNRITEKLERIYETEYDKLAPRRKRHPR
jgi:glycosyltransferase involved in cell wall biosynthesis